MPTLYEYLTDIKGRIRTAMDDIITACEDKGVVGIPESAKLSQLANYIRAIYQSDFEFYFNFQDIDQFGNPHAVRSGSPAHSMTGIDPSMDDITIPVFDFNEPSITEGELHAVKQGIWFRGPSGWLTTAMPNIEPVILEPVSAENNL